MPINCHHFSIHTSACACIRYTPKVEADTALMNFENLVVESILLIFKNINNNDTDATYAKIESYLHQLPTADFNKAMLSTLDTNSPITIKTGQIKNIAKYFAHFPYGV